MYGNFTLTDQSFVSELLSGSDFFYATAWSMMNTSEYCRNTGSDHRCPTYPFLVRHHTMIFTGVVLENERKNLKLKSVGRRWFWFRDSRQGGPSLILGQEFLLGDDVFSPSVGRRKTAPLLLPYAGCIHQGVRFSPLRKRTTLREFEPRLEEGSFISVGPQPFQYATKVAKARWRCGWSGIEHGFWERGRGDCTCRCRIQSLYAGAPGQWWSGEQPATMGAH